MARSVYEFHKIIDAHDPVAHGGKPRTPYRRLSVVLVRVLGQAAREGLELARMAEVIAKLIARLGYEPLRGPGGDWAAASPMVGLQRWRTLHWRAQQLSVR
jgi:hypothetical protein